MARTWLQIRVELEGGRDIDCDPPPGRVFMVGPSHRFADLAEAIDSAFARWDLAHLHVFVLPDGREVGVADVDPAVHDWRHRCEVLPEKADPREEYGPGPLPRRPVAIWGWGWMPDQYGRVSLEE